MTSLGHSHVCLTSIMPPGVPGRPTPSVGGVRPVGPGVADRAGRTSRRLPPPEAKPFVGMLREGGAQRFVSSCYLVGHAPTERGHQRFHLGASRRCPNRVPFASHPLQQGEAYSRGKGLLRPVPCQMSVALAEPKRRMMRVVAALTLALGAALGEAGSVTISNLMPRRGTQGGIMDAHDGKIQRFQGEGPYFMHAVAYGDCLASTPYGCDVSYQTEHKCGFQLHHNISVYTWTT
jgi:hypothetical protein